MGNSWNQGAPWKKKLAHFRDTTALLTEVKAALQKFGDSYAIGDFALTTGACTQKVYNSAADYSISGVQYNRTAVATALTGCTVPTAKYGAFSFDVGANTTIDVAAASGNKTGYASAALALAGLSSAATDHARMGTLVVYAGACNFVPGTTHIAGGSKPSGLTTTFADASTLFEVVDAAITETVPEVDV